MLKKLIAAYLKVTGVTETALMVLSSLFLGVVLVSMFLGLLGRDLLTVGFGFLEELSTILLSFIAFLGMGVMVRQKRHIRADFLDSLFRTPRARAALSTFIDIAMVVGAVMLTRGALDITIYSFLKGTTTVTEIVMPVWVGYTSLCIGGVFLVMWSIEQLVRDIAALSNRRGSQPGKG